MERANKYEKKAIVSTTRDLSTDLDKVHGFRIDVDTKLDERILPPGTSKKDAEEAWSTGLDVCTLPGKAVHEFSNADTAHLLADAVGQKHKYKRVLDHDRDFNKAKRHGLTQMLKSEQHFLEGYELIREKETGVCKLMKVRLNKFMDRRRVPKDKQEMYLLHGGLPSLINRTLRMYINLLSVAARKLD